MTEEKIAIAANAIAGLADALNTDIYDICDVLIDADVLPEAERARIIDYIANL